MKELIEVKNENGELLVSARELHKGLEIKTRYDKWINRMLEYGFEEKVDYIVTDIFDHNSNGGRQNKIEHILKIDCAKEIAMIQRNEKGKQVRKYFIDCEKRLKEQKLSLTLKQELQLSILNGDDIERISSLKQYEKLIVQEATKPLIDKIEEDRASVEFAEQVASSADSIDIGTFAKLLKDEDINIGRNKLFDWLRDNKYLRKNNEPYQQYIDNGYFEVIEQAYNTPYGIKINIKTKITGKGQVRLTEKLRKLFN